MQQKYLLPRAMGILKTGFNNVRGLGKDSENFHFCKKKDDILWIMNVEKGNFTGIFHNTYF